ncbi:hypothetical protein L211DRAFT_847149 [Terfezia boudieri ATCC MYA-4762]|uniref:Zn(2)-C6 fungal-type domain-containing protein n=1 Tax=Terfezia boudieri ATCC MYA-4762 TaxID=1051890 RepID=A0A3N4LUC5_9PEZI|nr:hypothetical protein L211DRAFT_847149 [Terfezia boudieri ATCC MYA-4762]
MKLQTAANGLAALVVLGVSQYQVTAVSTADRQILLSQLCMTTLQTYGHDARRTITPTMSPKAALAKPALVQHSSLKHTKSQPGWVLMPKIPRKSIGQRPLTKDVEDNADTDAYTSELQSSRVPTGQTRANSRTILCEQKKFLNLEKVSVREAVSPPTTKRSGRTGIPLSELGGPHPRGRANLIAQQCIRNLADNAPLQTANRADSNQHPLHLDPENSVYQNDPTFCWGCEDAKSRCDKKTGLCKKCELYLVPCLEWTPEKMVQTPRTTIHHSQEVLPVHSTCGQRSDSPTLG